MKTIFEHQCAACGEYSFKYHPDSHRGSTSFRWVCDECRAEMSLVFSDGGQSVEQTPTGRRCERTVALLAMRNNPRFMLIRKGLAWDGDLSSKQFFYEEHTCPSNLLKSEEIIADGEVDPHGIFELVEEVIITGPNARDEDEVIESFKAFAAEKTGLNYINSISVVSGWDVRDA